ncbi:transcriptional repressor [Flavobacterium sp.]|uniref:Fur family transcriptional regulator n=1 Tax=Flavobacterium sp. TaxID=239 RepID=UPI00286E61C8|nr:transcriptional repressor [Flavobacterium sp.]
MKTIRNTPSKSAILELISHSEVALSHIEIQNILNGLCDRVTIYRVLERLVNEDLVHKIATPEGIVKYASCNHMHKDDTHTHNHIHFNCEKCLAVTCLDNVVPSFKLPENYKIKEMNFTLTGLCPNCI